MSTEHADIDLGVGEDDYSLARVPDHARYSWFAVCMQRFAQLSAITQFLIGVTIGAQMTFWNAVLAITLGAVILEIVCIFLGIAGVREGLSTSLLARWSGFGIVGSALVSLMIAITSVGWFGIQNGVFAQSMASIAGGLPEWAWAVVGGLLVTVVVLFGFLSMQWVAYVTVPAFVLLALWSIVAELQDHSLGDLVSMNPPGPDMPLALGATMVAGGFIVGAIFTPDMTRFNRTSADVVKQTVVGVTIGEYVICLIAVLLAHAVPGGDVTTIIAGTSGLVGTIVMVTAIVKVNDWNLYPASLSVVNAVALLTGGVRVSRGLVTVVLGLLGTVASAAGMLDGFDAFLVTLGVGVPPIAGILIAEYFVVRSWRGDLDESRAREALPATAPLLVPASLLAWAAGWAAGHWITWGIPALTSIVVAFALYTVLGLIGLARGVGQAPTAGGHHQAQAA